MSKIINLIINIIIGLVGYEIYQFLFIGSLQLPLSSTQISELFVFIAVAFVGNSFPRPVLGTSSSREQGTVKWFNARKGYGFITTDQGDDIFVHSRNIEGSGRKPIPEGERVSFVVIQSDKGPQADKVKID